MIMMIVINGTFCVTSTTCTCPCLNNNRGTIGGTVHTCTCRTAQDNKGTVLWIIGCTQRTIGGTYDSRRKIG